MVALEYAEKAHEMGIDPTAPAAAAIAEPEPVAEPEPELMLRLAPLGE